MIRRVQQLVLLAGITMVLASSQLAAVGKQPNSTRSLACYGCHKCIYDDYSVPAVSTEPDTWWISFSFYCPGSAFDVPCSEMPGCDPEDVELMPDVEKAIGTSDVEALRRLLDDNPERLTIVPERSALQVLDCSLNGVYAQFEVDPTTLTELSST